MDVSIFGMMKLGVVLWVVASPLAALECRFEVECVEEGACQEAGYEMTLAASADAVTAEMAGQQFAVQTVIVADQHGQNIALVLEKSEAQQAFSWVSGFGTNLLTIDAAGHAWYSVHISAGETSVLYRGLCEGGL